MLSQRWRASVPVVAAVAVVAALSLLTVTVMSNIGGDDERSFVDVDGSTSTTEATRRVPPRPTTTTTSEAPEVLGETTERDPDVDADADADPDADTPVTTAAPAPAAPAPATPTPTPAPTAPPTTSAPAPTAPPTTVCRNSTDPSCGDFSWDPQPGDYDVEVYAVSTPVTATAGEPVTFAVDYIDPAGPDAEGACLNWFVTDPAVVNTSSCEVLATACDRTGPHDPPAPSRERISLQRTIVFETPGEHEVTIGGNIATHLADGCESPYTNSFSRTFIIVVS
ncbi:hypothetical protein NHL50_04880 [Acidimicrobiia bacterium EGI L10123]|uniref:hypothetical protein n=1 Tax=Salinilacustrithrix flava TaxID=2957203 RepID=UPI003D7C1ADE|nr:hypothetical protein [Acidimicrobiia bacterium EGI L10123]